MKLFTLIITILIVDTYQNLSIFYKPARVTYHMDVYFHLSNQNTFLFYQLIATILKNIFKCSSNSKKPKYQITQISDNNIKFKLILNNNKIKKNLIDIIFFSDNLN